MLANRRAARLEEIADFRIKWAHLQFSVGDYPKIVHTRYMKNGRSDTPLS